MCHEYNQDKLANRANYDPVTFTPSPSHKQAVQTAVGKVQQ